MDKNAVKKYAVWARRELISRVAQRAERYNVKADGLGDVNADSVNGQVLSAAEKQQRAAFIKKVQSEGYEQAVEEVAYTWFNRFCALRYMEVNGCLPSHVRVFTNDAGELKPQIIDEALHLDLDGLDMEKVLKLKENAGRTEDLFRYLLITQCNALSSILPGMFQKIEDYTELLLPDNLLREGSVIDRLIAEIPEEDWTDQVQIIGWLYQYYNAEKKDEVFADLKKNIKITKENIPAATQLFTPDWIVRYMVENSLGRLWLEGHPNEELKANWNYYLDEAEQEPEVEAQLSEIRKEYSTLKPEEILCIDPCAGSGHIICCLFDILLQIYESYGYTTREAVSSIVENNLYGLDIDERAAQLAYFSVMMKARSYDRRFFSRGIQPHVYAIRESNEIDKSLVDYFVGSDPKLRKDFGTLMNALYDAKEYGSILNITPVDFDAMFARVEEVKNDISFHVQPVMDTVLPLIQTGQVLAQKYDVVVTNPPYMGAGNMNPKLSEFIKKNYADYKSDFFSTFIVRCKQMAKPDGYLGFFTPYVWMFNQSHEKLRNLLYTDATIETLIQFEYSAFEEATVPVCTFAFQNRRVAGKKGCYLRLTEFRGGMEVQRQKTLEAIANHNCGFYYEQCSDYFFQIPNSPTAYWVTPIFCKTFQGKKISDYGLVKSGMQTGNNDLFLRFWYEVAYNKIGFGFFSSDEFNLSSFKWAPQTKGGDFRKWYGNFEYLVNFENNCFDILQYPRTVRTRDLNQYFKEGITWTHTTAGTFGARLLPNGFTFNVESPTLFVHTVSLYYIILGLMNSKVAQSCLWILNSAYHYHAEDILNIPVTIRNSNDISVIVKGCISLSQSDWDSFETSWDFVRHPLVRPAGTVAEAYAAWEDECNTRFAQLKTNEETLNRIFIDIYGLQDELTPEVEEKDVTVRRADLQRDVKSLISYAVGCMFGRYSLDEDGLVFAGGEWDPSKYQTYQPDYNGILPICDDEYFTDDIVGHFVDFIRAVYGEDTLEENLQFIADALGGTGSSREVIRKYFLNDFYADHCKIYQKRPIYWLFDSGKKNGFKCLIYLHRYRPDTIARIRTDYVHEQQARYRTAMADVEKRMTNASTSDRIKLNKQLKKLQDQADELHGYEEKIHHLADQFIGIDLDDGVKENYKKFQDVLAKIK